MDIDLHSPDNRKLFELMRADHPTLPAYILENCIRFYRAGIIDELESGNRKKKRGRPRKNGGVPPPPPPDAVGAVTITSPSIKSYL